MKATFKFARKLNLGAFISKTNFWINHNSKSIKTICYSLQIIANALKMMVVTRNYIF